MTEALTIPGLLQEAAHRYPAATAIADGMVRLTFGALWERAVDAAAAYVAAGLETGELVAIWAPNCADWIIACVGAQAAGGVLVPLNTRFKGPETRYILERASVAMIAVTEGFLGTNFGEMLADWHPHFLRRRIVFGQDSPDGWTGFLAGADGPARVEAQARIARIGADSVSDIMFTSGTTGNPKGVVAAHGQTVRTARLYAQATSLGPDDRYLILWPFFHCSGYKGGWLAALAAGATVIPVASLDVGELLDTVQREQVTFLPGPPTLFQTLLALENEPAAIMDSVRVAVTGASAVSPALVRAMRAKLGIPIVLTGYGLTETCGTVSLSRPDDPAEIVAETCGKAIEGIEIACVDATTGRRLPAGQVGSVLVRGTNVMQEYLEDPQATAAAIGADVWLGAGAGGMVVEEGYLRIGGGSVDGFIVGGLIGFAAEIEKAIQAHPAIAQVAIKGVPDARLGEVGRAYVVLKNGHHLDHEQLVTWCRERMANYKVPREIRFLPELPTNATGKVQKFRLPA